MHFFFLFPDESENSQEKLLIFVLFCLRVNLKTLCDHFVCDLLWFNSMTINLVILEHTALIYIHCFLFAACKS